ncbi:MAG: terpene cyclase/mutase family protein [Thermoguttaceae bacterium]|nr:terpene cyclase/mutase family protein [Thermoguttaceae bacterium]
MEPPSALPLVEPIVPPPVAVGPPPSRPMPGPSAAPAGGPALAEERPLTWREWFREDLYWYLTSAVVHAIGFVIFAILAPLLPETWTAATSWFGEAPSFEAVEMPSSPGEEVQRYELGEAPLDPTELNTATLLMKQPPSQTAKFYDDSDEFEEAGGGRPIELTGPPLGGLGGFTVVHGPGIGGLGGVGVGKGTSQNPGAGGDGFGFGRGRGHRAGLAGGGGTKPSERAVAAALYWLQRHQAPAGNWSLQFGKQCASSYGCSGEGSVQADAAATAMALLPFLAAGQTHKEKGPFQKTINRGIAWLIKHQKDDGDLSCGALQPMYSHGLAAIALCEAYGMTRDEYVGRAAAKSLRFIEMAQNQSTGGWRYTPGSEGDTSVVGWQVMALKSGQMAGLGVNTFCFEQVQKWLRSVAKGHYGGLSSYQPHKDATPAMTAVGLLCRQYLGEPPDSQKVLEAKQYLLGYLPSADADRDTYYWYYATMAMHNFMDKDWDTWNRQMRRVLITTQCKQGCAEGSWDPDRPTQDKWGASGGRLMTTCLSTLTLEVYYRYLPLFRASEASPTPPANKTLANGR